MLILSCQREILPMFSIGQTDMSVGHSVKTNATNALFAFRSVWTSGLAEEIFIQLNKLC